MGETPIDEVVEAIYREYGASLLADDPGRWAAQWAEDAVQMPANAPTNVGLDEIRRWIERALGEIGFVEFDVSIQEAQLIGSDRAFARGVYTYLAAPKQGGEPIAWDGKVLTMFSRQSDGSWKIYRDIFNSNLPQSS